MTKGIFLEWFQKNFVPQVKDFLRKRNLLIKAVLILDNAPNYSPEKQLRSNDGSIFVMFMPPNVTPLIQSMVIKVTELYYLKFLLSPALSKNPKNISESLKQVTLRETVLNLHIAWNALNQQTIRKCWKNLFYSSDDYDDEDNVPLTIIRKQLLSDAEVIDSASSDVLKLLKAINSDIVCTVTDVGLWNDDKEMGAAHQEKMG